MTNSHSSCTVRRMVCAAARGPLLALCICLFAAPSFATGGQGDSAQPHTGPDAGQPLPRAASPLSEGRRAQLVAIRQAVLSSELAGRIVDVHFREGERFKKGDKLVTYDSSLYRARLDRAVQAEAAAVKRFKIAQELRSLGSISIADYEQAQSEVAIAKAETRTERVMVNRCRVDAPFSGRVGETYVREAEHVAEGAKMMSIYDDSAFEIETILPSNWLAWLKPGYPMTITVDEIGGSYQARVSRIAGVVDPVSQSVKIIALIRNAPAGHGGAPLMPGMGGTVFVEPPHATPPTSQRSSSADE